MIPFHEPQRRLKVLYSSIHLATALYSSMLTKVGFTCFDKVCLEQGCSVEGCFEEGSLHEGCFDEGSLQEGCFDEGCLDEGPNKAVLCG